jgi:beta-alanine degradation protein BauB
MGMDDGSGQFDVTEFARELAGEPNHQVGTRLLLSNDRVKVWEIVLGSGERVPFHWHTHPYFYVCTSPGRARTRFPNGYYVEGDEDVGGVAFMEHSADDPGIHDLENVGDTTIRYTTVELL